MNYFIKTTITCVFLIFNICSYAEELQIGFISDGTNDAKRIQALIVSELTPLLGDETYIKEVSLVGDASQPSMEKAAKLAFSNPDIDIVIAPDFLSSNALYHIQSFSKPTFLTQVIDPHLMGANIKTHTKNLYWLSMRNDIEATFDTIKQIIGDQKVTLLIDTQATSLGESFFTALQDKANKMDVKFNIVVLNASGSPSKQLTKDTKLVLLPPMRNGSNQIIKQLKQANIPVFTFEGPTVVEQGAMMTNVVDAVESQIARRIALDIYSLVNKDEIKTGPRWLDPEHHLTINLLVAQQLGVDLPIDIISNATIVGFDDESLQSINLDQVLHWAQDKNDSIALSNQRVQLAKEATLQSRSALLPQITTKLNHTRYSSSGSTVESGNPDQNSQVIVDLSQSLYSLANKTDLAIKQQSLESQSLLASATLQTTIQNAALAYLQVLILDANLAAQQENLRLSRSNSSMAHKREKLGSGAKADVYNAEAAIANANSNLLNARILSLEARRNLSEISNTPFDENVRFKNINLEHQSIKASHQLVLPMLETINGIQQLAIFSTNKAHETSPELLALARELKSSEIQLQSAQRGRYIPEVSLSGKSNRFIQSSTGSSGLNLENVDDFSLSVNVNIPLWTSGRLSSLIRQASHNEISAKINYNANKNNIETTTRNATYNLAQAWQDIKLGEIELKAADKSLTISQSAYANGAITIENLQSVQTTYISALSNAKANVYQYIQALFTWQRQVAALPFLMDKSAYQQWRTSFTQSLN